MSILGWLVSRLRSPEELVIDERRGSVRLNFRCTVLLEAGRRRLSAELLNLTFTGLCLRVTEPLEIGTELLLRRDDHGAPFTGTVLWCKKKEQGYLVGVQGELDEEKLINSWLEPTLRQAGFIADYVEEKRKLLRIPGRLPCSLSEVNGPSLGDGELLDLSLGGALLETEAPLTRGHVLRFRAAEPGGSEPLEGTAKVVSGSGPRYGLNFLAVEEEKVRAYLKALHRAQGREQA